jgi:hypothetical protein
VREVAMTDELLVAVKGELQRFVHDQNIAYYKKLMAAPNRRCQSSKRQ